MEETSSMTSVLSQTAQDAMSSDFWWDILIKVISCVAIIVMAFVLYRLIMLPVKKFLVNDEKSRRGGTIFKNVVRVGVSVWAIACILDIAFNIDMAGILGALGIVGVAVSLGAQQTIANLIGGIIISLSETLATGDWIVIAGAKEAQIVDVGWRLTKLVDEDGVEYLVPNSKMVSEIVTCKLPFYTIVVPFTLKTTVPDVEGLLVDCEQVLLDRQKECGIDYEEKRPKANVSGANLGAIQAEVKLFVNRDIDTRSAERALLPALVNLLQERDAFAEFGTAQVER